MHCETLLRLSIEEVNFTSVRRTNIELSVLKAKQLQWTTTVCKNCRKGETLAHYDKTSYGEKRGGTVDPQQNGKILVGLAQWTGGRTSQLPGYSHPELKNELHQFRHLATMNQLTDHRTTQLMLYRRNRYHGWLLKQFRLTVSAAAGR